MRITPRLRTALIGATLALAATGAVAAPPGALAAPTAVPSSGTSAPPPVPALCLHGPPTGQLAKIDFKCDVPIGPAIFQTRGTIDTTTDDIDSDAYLKVPLFPAFNLGHLSGNLKDGVTGTANTGISSGTYKLYLDNQRRVTLDYDLTIFGRRYQGTVPLITLPPTPATGTPSTTRP